MNATSRTILVLILLALTAGAAAQHRETREQRDERMGWWRDARFGLFIHWGLYAIPAGEWKGGTNHAEWIRTTAQIPLEEYDEFVGQFNPVEFDADEWVRIAKRAGMKYIVITSKHHDGFGLFDSKLTDFDVMSTPFGRDILKELAEACRREGLRMCWYHSIMDWHHPDYLPRRGWEKERRSAEGADYGRFVRYLHGQVEELLTNYGDIGIMWFDGEWEGTWSHEHGLALDALCRRLQPDVIVNNRVDKGRGGMAGLTSDAKYAGDYGTPEQEIPDTGLPGVDWETCMTMNRHWGYNKNDDDWKSSTDLIRKLVDIASKGGNFLLNVGPTAEGEFPQESIDRLEAMGAWMDAYGESIYGTTASPFSSLPWGRCTARDLGNGKSRLYLHVFDWPDDGRLVVPGLGNEIDRAELLGRAGPPVATLRVGADVHVLSSPAVADPHATVIALDIVGRPIIYEMPEIRAAADILVRPMNVEIASDSDALDVHFTVDGTDPTASSPRYLVPIPVEETTTVKARAFHRGRAVSGVAERTFTRVTPSPPARTDGFVPGLRCAIYAGEWDVLPDFDDLAPRATRSVPTLGLGGSIEEHVARRFTGFITVPAGDVYVFALDSDDGSRLVIDGTLVVDNDGLHGPQELRGTIALAAGPHELTVDWFNKTGGAALELRFAPVGQELKTVPAAVLSHR